VVPCKPELLKTTMAHHDIKIACYNARGVMPSCRYIGDLLSRKRVDILCISEHWLFPEMLSFLDSIHIDYTGYGVSCKDLDPIASHRRGKGGVAILFKKSIQHMVTSLDIDDDRICGISVSFCKDIVIKILSVYLPSSNHTNASYSDYIEKLYDLHNEYSMSEDCIFMGDFNAPIYQEGDNHSLTTRSKLLSKFIDDAGLMSLNMSKLDSGPMYTFDPISDHSVTSMIDHILIEQCKSQWVTNCAIIDDLDNTSDHLPIVITLRIRKSLENVLSAPNFHRTLLKWDKLSSDEIALSYSSLVTDKCKDIPKPCINASCEDIDKYYAAIVTCLYNCAKDSIPAKKYKPYLKPFWSSELSELHTSMKSARRIWIDAGQPRDASNAMYQRYKEAKRTFRRAFRAHAHKAELDERDQIEISAEMDQKTFWKHVNSKRKPANKTFELKVNGKVCATSDDILDGWHEHFTSLYQPTESETFNSAFKHHIHDVYEQYVANKTVNVDSLDKAVDIREVVSACRELKLKVAGGFDQLTYEHLKHGGDVLYDHLSYLFSLIICTEHVPPNMKIGLTITLLKQGKKDKTDPNNYRGITLLPVIYKLFEKVTLLRMLPFLNQHGLHFPDPVQGAYQKNLSSINTTFCVKETINYNLERGSKVYVCFLDSVKAFDCVWHEGLFVRLYEAGIKGKLWKTMINAYSNMYNQVLHNNCLSKHIPVKQSTRQGSFWGAWFYLLFINPLINILRQSGIGAKVGDLFCGALFFADDIALLAIDKEGLQSLINICYTFACQWRFTFHPQKTKILVCGESPQQRKRNCEQRVWYVGSEKIREVTTHVHCGVPITSDATTIQLTKQVCRKGRGVMLSLLKAGLGGLNPLTLIRLYQSIVQPSALFGCELWGYMSETERTMLERMQRFCSKIIQQLNRRTRSDICCSLLGLWSAESYIDKAKLSFLRRLAISPGYTLSKSIFLRRLFHCKLSCTKKALGFCPDIIRLLQKYNLQDMFETAFIQHGKFPDNIPWKNNVVFNLKEAEVNMFDTRTANDDDFSRFRAVQCDIHEPNIVWNVARAKPHMLDKCRVVVKYIANPNSAYHILCEYCGVFFTCSLTHLSTQCCSSENIRNEFWDNVTNTFPIEVAAVLYNMDDVQFVNTILGAALPFRLNDIVSEQLLITFINFVYNIDQFIV
jgi:exonuclease III